MAQESITNPHAGAAPIEWKGTDRYEILGCLGRGGMGVVYEAFDRERRQLVAVKTLPAFDPAALYLFKQEFRTLADVRHTNLVHLYELEVTDAGQVFFTMELLRGTHFREYVERPEAREVISEPPTVAQSNLRDRRARRLPGEDGARCATALLRPSPADMDRLRGALRQLVEGIYALHAAGKLHRDIKPSNVLVTHDGRIVLLDFGVATELSSRGERTPSGSGEVVGTARYMAPEQADDASPSPASDWYSVGVMLYESLVGRPPFVGSMLDVLTMKSEMDPLPPSECVDGVPPDLDVLCQSLLHRDPAMRPTGLEILRRLGVTRSSGPPSLQFDPADAVIGRTRHLDALREAFQCARTGRAVTVRIGGAAGMGKSTVAQSFLDEVARNREAVILRGRAYEREAVPYKAVDSAIDALSRHLMYLDEVGAPLALPDDAWALARLFPVLQRIPGIRQPNEQTVGDPQSLRGRAFAALRELLASLAARQPLIVFVDDAHWGDVDSAALLLDVLRPPNAPPLLFAMTYRDDEAQTSPFLKEMTGGWPEGAEVRDVPVGPLEAEDALVLALKLLNASDEMSQRTARAVARESRGNPFLIGELVRSNRVSAAAPGATLAVLTLDRMVGERLDRLSDEARRLVEVVAVGGRPLPVSVVAKAADVQGTVNEVVAFLSGRRFVRTGLRHGLEVVETIHDRIRETIVAQLSADAIRGHHARLARVFEETPDAEPESVAVHLLGAGDLVRGAQYAERAADQAAQKLAFDQAARFYRLALEALPNASTQARALSRSLAKALEWGGRGLEAAKVYSDSAVGAPLAERVELERAAAEQLLESGHIDEGRAALQRILEAAGMSLPKSPLGALMWLVFFLCWQRIVGLRFRRRDPDEVSAADRLRIDALFTVASGMTFVDALYGLAVHARHFVLALRRGDRLQVQRAASYSAGQYSTAGGEVGPRERALFALARELTDEQSDPLVRLWYDRASATSLFLRGRWKEASQAFDRDPTSSINMAQRKTGDSAADLFGLGSLTYLGQMGEVRRRHRQLLVDAERRGNLYLSVNLRVGHLNLVWLAADDVDSARRHVHEAMRDWSHRGYQLQHYRAMIAETHLELYAGNGARAYELVVRDWPALKRNFLLKIQYVRADARFLRARAAIASLATAPDRKERLAEAARLARQLENERMPWTAGLASIVAACVAHARGDRDGAVTHLRAAAQRADAVEMLLHAMAARRQLGLLLGGDEGRTLVQEADDAMSAQGIRSPERFAGMLVPGVWNAKAGVPPRIDVSRPALAANPR
jgi:serine/threonine protein kinase